MTMRLRTSLAGLLAAASLAIAPAAAQERALRVSLNTELQVLDPIVVTINATRVFAYMVFDQLTAIDAEGKYHRRCWKAGRSARTA